MSLITFILLLLGVLLLIRCSNNKCKDENIFSIVINLLKKIFVYILDIFTYSIKRGYESDWFKDS